MKKKQTPPIPPLEELEAELKRMKYNKRYGSVLRSTVYALIIVAAVAMLIHDPEPLRRQPRCLS